MVCNIHIERVVTNHGLSKGGGAEIGPTKRGKGMKIMAIVDRHGLPLSVSTHAANHHEVRLVQLCFDFYMIEAKPETLIGDRAYDSDPLDDDLRKDGIEMVAPHRSREDDADSHGALSALRTRIHGELRVQLGRTSKTFRLWQDKEAIPSGTLWESEIKTAVGQSVFFIPIITPTVVASP